MAKIDNLYLLRERKVVAIMRAKNSVKSVTAVRSVELVGRIRRSPTRCERLLVVGGDADPRSTTR